MTVSRYFRFIVFLLLSALPITRAQQPRASGSPSSPNIQLNVVVGDKSGQPALNLQQQDFTILDNKTPRPLTSFKLVHAADEPVKVILLIDGVNTSYQTAEVVRKQLVQYLRGAGHALAYPTTTAVLAEDGLKVNQNLSTDGNAISDDLERTVIGLPGSDLTSEWGPLRRVQVCVNGFQHLLHFSSSLSGRKIILWISPGWPPISQVDFDLTSKGQQEIFNSIVALSTQIRQANVTLYNISPLGVTESLGRADDYQAYLKGIANPRDAQYGNLGVQVLAVQSGGLVLASSNDIASQIQKCLKDAESWYEIAFDPLPSEKPNEYHRIEIRLSQPGPIARTRQGYYSNPVIVTR